MIGGGGERKTLRMVAQYADESNLIAEARDLPRKLDALAEHCQQLGRDRSEITVSWQRSTCIAPTMEEAQADLAAGFRERGVDLASLGDDHRQAMTARFVVGDPDTVGERLAADLALGVDGFTLNAPLNGHVPGRVELLGRTAAAVVG
jgi:alkanesulfonate monooxygenase SsuD/methylene tetrahydromethanopterin reductase-like flavin-dependent oxidoreductase (luciferase family)